MSDLLERCKLTEEQVIEVAGVNRIRYGDGLQWRIALADAATLKTARVVLEELRPLVEAAETLILTLDDENVAYVAKELLAIETTTYRALEAELAGGTDD